MWNKSLAGLLLWASSSSSFSRAQQPQHNYVRRVQEDDNNDNDNNDVLGSTLSPTSTSPPDIMETSSPTSDSSFSSSVSDELKMPLMEQNTIIGGVAAAQGEFPAYVLFEGNVMCGGSLISANRVLTAGHCIASFGWPTAVRVGPTTTSNGEVVPVKCGVKHPGYISPFMTVINDIAILKLERDVTSVDPSNYMKLNTDNDYPATAGTPLTVVGFGKLSNSGGTSNTLQKVGTLFVPKETCQATYNSAVVRPNAHICADIPNKGDCNGDSGGPLMDENGLQVGIVSFGYGGCASDYQDVYTRVSNYDTWIQEQIVDETCPAGTGTNSANSCFTFFNFGGVSAYFYRIGGFGRSSSSSTAP